MLLYSMSPNTNAQLLKGREQDTGGPNDNINYIIIIFQSQQIWQHFQHSIVSYVHQYAVLFERFRTKILFESIKSVRKLLNITVYCI